MKADVMKIEPRKIEPTIPFSFNEFEDPTFLDDVYNIVDFGGVEGGKELNTVVIANAIAKAHENGGGIVLIPEGEWLTGPIHLKSNINLHIAEGATLFFSDDFDDYKPLVMTRWEGMECYNYSPLIYAKNCDNIAITGKGTVDGQGEKWHSWKHTQITEAKRLYVMTQEDIPVEERQFGIEGGIRPSFIQPFECTNVLIQDITIKSGPMWTIHPVYCENIRVNRCHIITAGSNTDGCNFDSCKNGIIEHCYFNTGDDCICLKSGINEDGWRVNRPCENIIIRYCYMDGGHGGIIVGSELSGGVYNILAYDCIFKNTYNGMRFKSMRGRGATLSGFYLDNIKMENIEHEGIILTMFYGASTLIPKSNVPTELKDVFITNLECKGCECGISIIGLPEKKIHDVTLENIYIEGDNDYELVDAENITIKNFDFKQTKK